MKDISISFVTTAVVQVANIATGLIAARLLLPEGRGELAALILWPGLIFELGLLGLSDALLYRSVTRAAGPRELFGAMTVLGAVQSLVLIAIGVVVLPYVFAKYPPEVRDAAYIFLFTFIPANFLAFYVISMFQGQLDLLTWNVLRVLVPLANLSIIGGLVAFDWVGAPTFAYAFALAHVVAAVIGLGVLYRRGWLGFRFRLDTAKQLIVYGARVHLGEMLNTARQRLDQALVAYWLPPADLGFYAVALTVSTGPMILVFTVANVAFPKISQQGTIAGKIEVFGRYLRFAIAVAGICFAILFVIAHWIVPLLFGTAFAASSEIVRILLIGLLPYAAKLMLAQILKAVDKSLAISHAELTGLIAAGASLVALIPFFGIVGAAWGFVIAHGVTCAVMANSLHRHLGVPLLPILKPTAHDWHMLRQLLRFRFI
ncbi:MAG: oligosaccharide flippase family protein [Rhodospirillales bacterium]|nr:oligosaccharide flippase family protein [Rhodospirillales bacterium]